MLRRSEENDPKAPEEISDISACACLFLPHQAEIGAASEGDDHNHREKNAAPTAPTAPAPMNCLVLAECLRRHAAAQKEVQGEKEERPEQNENEEEGPSAVVGQLLAKLKARGSVNLVHCRDSLPASECEDFARQCFNGRSADLAPFLAPMSPWLQDIDAASRMLCGGLGVVTNWKEHRIDATDPGHVRVPAHLIGRSPKLEDPVCYLATENNDVFIVVWKLPADSQQMQGDELYLHCMQVLRDASQPTDERASVLVPVLQMQSHVVSSSPTSSSQGGLRLGQPRELLAVASAARKVPRGALREAARQPLEESEGDPVITLDRAFVFCIWHADLDDIEGPLLATVVHPENFAVKAPLDG